MSKENSIILKKGLTPDKITAQKALATVKEELSKIEHINASAYKTNGNLESFSNIHNETDTQRLIAAYSSVKRRNQQYNEDALEIGFKKYPTLKMSGYTADAWIHDIKLRISIIQTEGRRTKLLSLEEKMREFLSKEEKMAEIMAGIEDLGEGFTFGTEE